MSDAEFHEAAEELRAKVAGLDRSDAIVEACRGSGNPALLAWLAEAAGIEAQTRVLDVGGGTGGPAAWLQDHYRCAVVVSDPVAVSGAVAADVFDLPVVVASGDRQPFAPDSFDVATMLGVLSVVDRPEDVLVETRRLAPRLAAIAYVSTTGSTLELGGSRFRPRGELHRLLGATGWAVEAGPARPTLAPPPSWRSDDQPANSGGDELAVRTAIGDGRIEPVVISCRRR